MFFILAAIVVTAAMSAVLFKYGGYGYKNIHTLSAVVGLLLGIGSGLSAVVYSFLVWGWLAADHKAQIINREYGTNYTQEEVFYASDVIETVRQLDRNRYEINGDLVHGQEAKP